MCHPIARIAHTNSCHPEIVEGSDDQSQALPAIPEPVTMQQLSFSLVTAVVARTYALKILRKLRMTAVLGDARRGECWHAIRSLRSG
jgi:hypothetical protein